MFCHDDAGQLKVHTVSRKSERLVNLTIALLATKRYLTKSEIFATVAGYSGDADAKDRMFERDKDDLRSLGIEIELGTFDPLFEDEAGYRIKPERYSLQISDLDTTSIALLSKAAQVWRDAALGESAQIGLRKLKGLGLESNLDSITGVYVAPHSAPEQLPDLITAITERREITFEYLNSELEPEVRKVHPYRLSNSRGYWYLIAKDILVDELRTFRVDRCASTINLGKSSSAYEIDYSALDEADQDYVIAEVAHIAIRRGRELTFSQATVVGDMDEDWVELALQFHDEERLLQEVLWLGEDCYIISPSHLRESIIENLERAIVRHG